MKKKIVLALGAILLIVAGTAGLSAYEAHIINTTAHIENALSVAAEHIEFGTVFPQEYTESSFTIGLSESFLAEESHDDVEYVINQKPKCVNNLGQYAPVNYWDDQCPDGYVPMQSLCRFLSKLPQNKNETEVGEQSYFDPGSNSCPERQLLSASGRLAKSENDTSDTWIVDLKVPPIAGYVGQDWPVSCSQWVVAEDEMDYGCDLWVEVTDISTKERYPESGNAYIGYEDWSNGDFDYNDFGMNFEAEEYYNGDDQLTKLKMTFTAMIYDSGAEHYIHIKRPLNGSYSYKVTRDVSYAGEIAAGNYLGSGELDVVLFNTAKYIWPSKQINETVVIEIILGDPSQNPKTALVAPRWDVDPFMDNYDPYEVVYGAVSGTFHIADEQTISSTANQKNTPEIIVVGIKVPFILVVPFDDWIPPYEDTTITGPYQYFNEYYASSGALYPDWFVPANVRPGHNVVGTGSLSWGPYF